MAIAKTSQKTSKGSLLKDLHAKAQKVKSSAQLLSAEDIKLIASIEALSNKKCRILYKNGTYTMGLISNQSPAVRGQHAVLTKPVQLFELPEQEWSNLSVAIKATWR